MVLFSFHVFYLYFLYRSKMAQQSSNLKILQDVCITTSDSNKQIKIPKRITSSYICLGETPVYSETDPDSEDDSISSDSSDTATTVVDVPQLKERSVGVQCDILAYTKDALIHALIELCDLSNVDGAHLRNIINIWDSTNTKRNTPIPDKGKPLTTHFKSFGPLFNSNGTNGDLIEHDGDFCMVPSLPVGDMETDSTCGQRVVRRSTRRRTPAKRNKSVVHFTDPRLLKTLQKICKENVNPTKKLSKENVSPTRKLSKENVNSTRKLSKENVNSTRKLSKENVNSTRKHNTKTENVSHITNHKMAPVEKISSVKSLARNWMKQRNTQDSTPEPINLEEKQGSTRKLKRKLFAPELWNELINSDNNSF